MASIAPHHRAKTAHAVPDSRTPALARVDGQVINVRSLPDAVARCVDSLRAGRSFTLFTLNLDHLVRLRADDAFRAAYARAAFVTADGAPVVRLARRRHAAIERTTGADLVEPLCAAAAQARLPVYLFGAAETTLGAASRALMQRHPHLVIVGAEAPPMGFDPFGAAADVAGARIARSGARLCFVALGAPKQELFADRMARRHDGIGWLGIGAALDFIAADKIRAPGFMQRAGLEWLWRLAQEPRRLGLRYVRCAALLAALSWREWRERPSAPETAP
jgi:exopolysaccharide biosynthesis WecB/TagA/CpsF family protein